MSKNKGNIDVNMPVFEAKCINNSNKCKLMYVGCQSKNKILSDYPIEFSTTDEIIKEVGKNAYPVCEYKNHKVIAKIMCCSISGGYLSQFENIPCYYMTLLYTSDHGSGTLATVGLNFVINNDSLNKISLKYEEEQKLEKKNKKLNKKNNGKVVTETSNEPVSNNTSNEPESNNTSNEQTNKPSNEPIRRTFDINLKKLINVEWEGEYYITITYDTEEQEEFLKSMKQKYDTSSKENENKYNDYLNLFFPKKLLMYQTKNMTIYNIFLKYLKNEIFMDFVHFIIDKRIKDKIKHLDEFCNGDFINNNFSYRKLKNNLEYVDKIIDDKYDKSSDTSDDEQ